MPRRTPEPTPTEEEVLEKKPRHPEATAMIMLATVFLIGAIVITWSHLGFFLVGAEEDVLALEQEIRPAGAALNVVIKRDKPMKDIIWDRYTPFEDPMHQVLLDLGVNPR